MISRIIYSAWFVTLVAVAAHAQNYGYQGRKNILSVGGNYMTFIDDNWSHLQVSYERVRNANLSIGLTSNLFANKVVRIEKQNFYATGDYSHLNDPFLPGYYGRIEVLDGSMNYVEQIFSLDLRKYHRIWGKIAPQGGYLLASGYIRRTVIKDYVVIYQKEPDTSGDPTYPELISKDVNDKMLAAGIRLGYGNKFIFGRFNCVEFNMSVVLGDEGGESGIDSRDYVVNLLTPAGVRRIRNPWGFQANLTYGFLF